MKKKQLKENYDYINVILDKINKYGYHSLSRDEKTYLKQHSEDKVDTDLEKWLFNDDPLTFDKDENKTSYYEFDDDEDIFENEKKLIRIISKILKKEPYSNNADWGGGYAWNINDDNKFEGQFIYLGDDSLELIERYLDEDGNYETEILEYINDAEDLNKLLYRIIKNKKT